MWKTRFASDTEFKAKELDDNPKSLNYFERAHLEGAKGRVGGRRWLHRNNIIPYNPTERRSWNMM